MKEFPGVVYDTDHALRTRTGWTAGVGAELAIAPAWSVRVEYLYDQFAGIDLCPAVR